MLRLGLADNHPVVHQGIKSYFSENKEISLVGIVDTFDMVPELIKIKKVDVLLIDLELEGLGVLNKIKDILQRFSNLKIVIYSNLNEQIYAPNIIKAGVSSYLHKSTSLADIENILLKVNRGAIIFSDSVKKNMTLISKKPKSERMYRKLSNREIEVLRYLCDGKKNKEVAAALNLNEKTVSTYKLRLLIKLNVTNLVDLVNKAKTLEII